MGAWRYNYSYVCGIIRDYLDKPLVRRDRALTRMLRRRNRHYDLLEHYQHAVHAFKVEHRAGKAIAILWPIPVPLWPSPIACAADAGGRSRAVPIP